MKPLQETFIFKHLNQNGRVTKNISDIIKGNALSKENLASQFLVIEKSYKFGLKQRVLKAFEDGQIILVFAQPTAKLPSCIPFFLTKSPNGDIVGVVCVDQIGSINDETMDVKCEPKKLYTLMEAAYLGRVAYLYQRNLGARNALITNGSAIYSSMFIKHLNKQFSLSVQPDKQAIILFLAAKFYMINLLGMRNNNIVDNYAMKVCKNPNFMLLQELSDTFPDEAFKDLASFIQALTTHDITKSILPGLTVRGYLEQFIFTFDGSALLALESFIYFMTNVLGVVHGAYINNQYNFESIVDVKGSKMYVDMSNI